MTVPNYNLDELERKDTYLWRLAREHQILHQLALANPTILEYEIDKLHPVYPSPPSSYKIKYKVKSIVILDPQEMPVFGKEHIMHIHLPKDYPIQTADCKMITKAWHPNISSERGTICTNHKEGGPLFWIDDLVIRIGEYLQYKKYMAENKDPWPEDQKVAKWVREFAEPKGLFNKEEYKFIDNTPWVYVSLDDEEDTFGGLTPTPSPEPIAPDIEIEIEVTEITNQDTASPVSEANKLEGNNKEVDNIIKIKRIK